jgi:[NiFe] hydrogenase assembly HybE family chaperone
MSFDRDPASAVTRTFQRIHDERWVGMPVLNAALRVEASGFVEGASGWLGVLITPWSMSLIRLPSASGEWISLPVGGTQSLEFPCGVLQFTADHDPELGEYQTCQLFSPMYHFTDQDMARTAAHAALGALRAAPPPAPEPVKPEVSDSRRRLLRGLLGRSG